jgi:hypothetical protein
MSSSNIDDARARASSPALVEFEKSIMDRVDAEAVQNLHRVLLEHASHAILFLGFVLLGSLRACSVSSQSIWIEWDWMGLNPKQVKPLLIFFQSHPIHVF